MHKLLRLAALSILAAALSLLAIPAQNSQFTTTINPISVGAPKRGFYYTTHADQRPRYSGARDTTSASHHWRDDRAPN